jgi:hypothetical protein
MMITCSICQHRSDSDPCHFCSELTRMLATPPACDYCGEDATDYDFELSMRICDQCNISPRYLEFGDNDA